MAIETRGIFTLKELTNDLLKGEGVTYLDVFSSRAPEPTANFGIVAGGSPGSKSSICKILFSDDTASTVPATLSAGRYHQRGAGNQNDGYIIGGFGPSVGSFSGADKYVYSVDTCAVVPGLNMSAVRSDSAFSAFGNLNEAYISGGYVSGYRSDSDKLTYSTDTMAAAPASNLTTIRGYMSATAGPSAGYIGGGIEGLPVSSTKRSTMDKLTYSTGGVAAVPGAVLSSARYKLEATGNSTHGYFSGGTTAPTTVSTTDKLTFADETTSNVSSANINPVKKESAASGNSTQGYWSGGPSNTTFKITYSNDTASAESTANVTYSPSATYAAGVSAREGIQPQVINYGDTQSFTGIVEGPNTGYNVGGYSTTQSDEINKVDMDTDTFSVVSGTLSTPRYTTGSSSSTTDGYIAGGQAAPGTTTITDKLTYASDSCSYIPGANLTATTYGACGSGNQSFGYFSGGFVPPNRSSTDKLTYSSDTTARVPSADMIENRRTQTALCDGDTTFMGGGVSNFEKLSFGSETCSAMPGVNLLTGCRYLFGPVGNKTDGYIAGGFPTPGGSLFQKLNYSSETLSMIPGNLYATTYGISAFGNLSYGYFTGGGTQLSNSGKMTYATETFADNPGTYLTTGHRYQTGVSSRRDNRVQAPLATPTDQTVNTNLNTGYLAQGSFPPGAVTHIQKVDLSTESYSLIPGQTSNALNASSGASSPSDGYVTGGQSPLHTITDKVVYSSDTASRAPNADLSAGRTYFSATSSGTSGYFMGGFAPPGPMSTTDKLVYSTDTMAVETSANLTLGGQYAHTCLGNSDAGYACGGVASLPSLGYKTSCQKLTYSSDTNATAPGTNMTPPAYGRTSGGNSTTHGYVSGGNPGAITRTDKLSFSTETVARQPSADILASTAYNASVGNTNFGLWIAGYISGYLSLAQKVNYSTDTASLSTPTPSPMYSNAGFGARQNTMSSNTPVVC